MDIHKLIKMFGGEIGEEVDAITMADDEMEDFELPLE